jgi:hypothetical protein
MAVATQVLEIPLPEGVEPRPQDVELLTATLRLLVALRHDRVPSWEERRGELEARGWKVDVKLGWQAEARRGHDCERAFGLNRDEALEELFQLTRLDDDAGVLS